MPDYGRDTDIGKPDAETVNVNVKVDDVIEGALGAVTAKIDESNEELKKVRTGMEILIDEGLEEED